MKNLLILIIVIALVGLVVWLLINKDKKIHEMSPTPTLTPTPTSTPESTPGPVTTYPNGLKIQDLAFGTGEEAVDGKTITVHYTGTLENGTKFDSSVDRGQPFSFVLGSGYVIQGWEQGFKGMKVGGKRKLIIPPALGYGSRGAGNLIPPNATLIFEVELLAVE